METEQHDNASKPSREHWTQRWLVPLLEIPTVGVAALWFVSLFGSWSITADLFGSFHHIYALVGLTTCLPLYALGRRPFAALAALMIFVNASMDLDTFPQGEQCDPNINVATLNALGQDNDVERTIEMLRENNVQVLAVTELGHELAARLSAEFPHEFAFPYRGTSGMGIYSKFPLEHASKRPGGWFPQLSADVQFGVLKFRIIAAHPAPPGPEISTTIRNQELAELAARVRESPLPTILAGDLNVTRHSPHFQQLLDAGLSDTRVTQGIHGTWPAGSPLRIGIDHVLPSEEFGTCALETAQASGSDHLPVIARLRFDPR